MLKEKMCYEIVNAADSKSEGIYFADDIAFREILLSENDLAKLEKKISEWEIRHEYKWSEEDLVYDVEQSGSGTKIIQLTDLASFRGLSICSTDIAGGYLLQDGEFIGVILQLEQITSYGMSYSQEQRFGIMLTDGRSYGKTSKHYSHCSTERDESASHYYYLINKSECGNK